MKNASVTVTAILYFHLHFSLITAFCEETKITRDSIVSAFRTELSDLSDEYATRAQSLHSTAIEKLQALRKTVAADNLDEAIRIRDAEKELADSSRSFSSKTGFIERQSTPIRSGEIEHDDALRRQNEKSKAQENGELLQFITGKSYRITFHDGSKANWTFARGGVLLREGRDCATAWQPLGNDAIVCSGIETGIVDICRFSADKKLIDIIYVGTVNNPKIRHAGVLIIQK